MPIIKSAMKHMRSDRRKSVRNLAVRSELKTLYKRLSALAGQNPGEAKEKAQLLISKLDKAARSGTIPKGRANRKKARIARLLSSGKPPAPSKQTSKNA